MATQGSQLRDGAQCVAAADLSAKQFYAVKVTAARAVNLASTGGEDIYGILQNKPTTGQPADICFIGITKVVAGAAITAGDELMTDTSGRLITVTSTNHRVAQALEAAGAAGDIITARIGVFNRAST